MPNSGPVVQIYRFDYMLLYTVAGHVGNLRPHRQVIGPSKAEFGNAGLVQQLDGRTNDHSFRYVITIITFLFGGEAFGG